MDRPETRPIQDGSAAAGGTTIASIASQIRSAVGQAIHGKDALINTALVVIFAEGHLLLEDVPGVGKTALARSLSSALGGVMRRIQCTPDLLPTDITGSSIYNQRTGDFEFRPGPIFGNVIIADEVNRAEPRTQSALLECMEERQVTVDGVTRPLQRPFIVVATQNPADMQGTFPLPEAQRDRFMARLSVGYPDDVAEQSILLNQATSVGHTTVPQVTDAATVTGVVEAIKTIPLSPDVVRYLVSVVRATRRHPDVTLGASTRAAVHLGRAVRALAAIQGRGHVLPDDVKTLAPAILSHRLVVAPHAAGQNITATMIVQQILDHVSVEAPASASVPPAESGRRAATSWR